MADITNADDRIRSADSAIAKLYQTINVDGENDNDRLQFAILTLAESQLAIARAIVEQNTIRDSIETPHAATS